MRFVVEHNGKVYVFNKFPGICENHNCAFHPCRGGGSGTTEMKSFCPRFSKTKKEGGWKEIT